MTFNQAYRYAMNHSELFRRHDADVKRAKKENRKSKFVAFSVSPYESFYYGFDGCEMLKGKYSRTTTEYLAKMGMLQIII